MSRSRQSRIRDAELSALIDLAYRAALEPAEWPRFLGELTRATGSEISSFLLFDAGDRAGEGLWCHGLPDETLRAYPQWASLNVHTVAAAPLMQPGALFRNGPAPRGEWLASEFYNDFLRPVAKVADAMGMCLLREKDTFAYVTSNRAVEKPDYGPREWEIYVALIPHLQRATAIQRRLGALELFRVAGEEALDRLSVAVFFVARDGTVLHHNAEARRLLAAGKDLSLTREGRLDATGSHGARRLARAVADACRTGAGDGLGAGGTFHLHRLDGRSYGVVVSPLRTPRLRLLPVAPAAVVLVTDPDRPLEATPAIERLYGLTAAEARLACRLASGQSLEHAADALGITRNTARWTLKQVFAKTGTTRQAALVRLLLAGPASILTAGA